MSIYLRWGPLLPPTVPFQILNVTEDQLTDLSVRVQWDTPEVSQGWIVYDTDTGSVPADYANETTRELSFTYDHHIQTISGLTPGEDYFYRIVAVNQAGQTVYSDEGTFTTTGGGGDSDLPWEPGITWTDYNIAGLFNETGSQNVSQAIGAWINANVPNGSGGAAQHFSRVLFAPGATYRVGGTGVAGITLRSEPASSGVLNRRWIWLCGRTDPGQTRPILQLDPGVTVTFTGMNQCLLDLGRSAAGGYGTVDHIIVTGFDFRSHLHAGVDVGLNTAYEAQHAVALDNVTWGRVSDCVSRGMGGDFVKATDGQDIEVHHNTNIHTGRQFVSMISGDDWYIHDNDTGHAGYYIWDVEPNTDGETATNFRFEDNTMRSWGPNTGRGAGFGAALSGLHYGLGSGHIEIHRNEFYGTGPRSSLRLYINQNQFRRVPDVRITDNVSLAADATGGNVMEIKSVDGLTVTGNTQPLRTGQGLLALTSVTDAVTSPNP